MSLRIELTEKKTSALRAAKALRDKAKSENRENSAEEMVTLKGHLDDVDSLKSRISAIEQQEKLDQELDNEIKASEKPTGRKTTPVKDVPISSDHKERVLDDPKRGFRSMGDFAGAVAGAMTPGMNSHDERLDLVAAATGLGQSINADGGFLVPPEFSTAIWDGMNQASDNLLNRTDGYTITGESLTLLANAETSRANGSRWGGVQGYWKSEAATMTASKPTFREVKLTPHELYVFVYCTDKLLRNSAIALDQYISRAASDEINFKVGDAIVNGTGAGQPRGILAGATDAPRVQIAKETGQAAATINKTNIDKMWTRLHAKSRFGAVWLINQLIETQLNNLTFNIGTAGVPVYLPAGGISASPYATLYGKPVIPVEYCQALGTEGDIILCDLKSYLTGQQGSVLSAMSMHLKFDSAQTAFRFEFAVDGQPALASSITPFKGGSTLSSIVTLATRA